MVWGVPRPRSTAWLLIWGAGCDPGQRAPPLSPTGGDSGAISESAPPGDSPAGDSERAGETGADSEGGGLASVATSSSGVIECADPDARDRWGPMVEVVGGSDWSAGQAPLEPEEDHAPGRAAAIADLDGDGLMDVFLANTGRSQIYMGRGGGLFADESAARWPGAPRTSVGAVAADVDDDGDLDLVVANRGQANGLFLNDGAGVFTEAAAFTAAEATTGVSLADMDADGDLDVFAHAHYYGPEQPAGGCGPPGAAGRAELYENLGGGTFADRSSWLPQAAHAAFTFAGGWHDLDGDGAPDLYLVNDFGPDAEPNLALYNRLAAGGGFEPAPPESGLGVPLLGMGLGVGDVNGDGVIDLLLSGWTELALLESVGAGRWADTALTRGLAPSGDSHVAWGVELVDMDCDGDLDAPVAFGHIALDSSGAKENPLRQPDALFVQGPGGGFVDEGPAWGLDREAKSRGFAVADLDLDGWPDVIQVALDAPARLMRSRCGDAAWLTVALEQPAPNGRAVGARVSVTAGGETLVRVARAGGVNLGSSAQAPLHFGLGAVEGDAVVEVRWPDGARSRVEGVTPRQHLRVRRLETD